MILSGLSKILPLQLFFPVARKTKGLTVIPVSILKVSKFVIIIRSGNHTIAEQKPDWCMGIIRQNILISLPILRQQKSVIPNVLSGIFSPFFPKQIMAAFCQVNNIFFL